MRAWTSTHRQARAHTHRLAHACPDAYTDTHAHPWTRRHTCMHTDTRTHIHTCAHAYTQGPARTLQQVSASPSSRRGTLRTGLGQQARAWCFLGWAGPPVGLHGAQGNPRHAPLPPLTSPYHISCTPGPETPPGESEPGCPAAPLSGQPWDTHPSIQRPECNVAPVVRVGTPTLWYPRGRKPRTKGVAPADISG